MISALVDWIYPPTCMACRTLLPVTNKPQRELWLCARCQSLFEPITAPICEKCGTPTESPIKKCVSCNIKTFHFTQNRATFEYDELIRDLMHDLKFRNKKHIAEGLGRLWAAVLSEENAYIKEAILVPIPMHPKKQRERGFNQAEILVAELSKKLQIPMENTLERLYDTPPQSGLHPQLRAENVDGVFGIRKGFLPGGKNYILVDDIYTTGASLNECAKTLKNVGANEISCMTLAITVKNNSNEKQKN